MKVARFNEIDDKERTPQKDMRPSREAFLDSNPKIPENPLDEDARQEQKE